jgi:uncharacterized RDD family membrane protein YckC
MIDSLILAFALIAVFGTAVGVVALAVPSDDRDKAAVLNAGVGFAFLIGYFVVAWLYEALMTSSVRGATLGKQAIGLRVVRTDGTQLSFGRATARHFAKAMVTPLVPLFIGYLLAAFTNRKQALHDFMAGTVVIESR